MRRHASLLVLAVALLGIMALEMFGGSDGNDGMMAPRPPSLPLQPGDAATDGAFLRQAVAAILARPLFAPSRRPAAVAAGEKAALPRLSGIVTDGGRRSAIFASAGDGKPLVLDEGGRVSGFVVERIEAGAVTLRGPGGPLALRPAFDPRPRPPPVPPAASPSSGAPGMPGVSGVPNLPSLPSPQGASAR